MISAYTSSRSASERGALVLGEGGGGEGGDRAEISLYQRYVRIGENRSNFVFVCLFRFRQEFMDQAVGTKQNSSIDR